ncbi:peptidoglycan-binding protein [Streptomyces sp. NPDC057757]|uniref:peptidoglycan-binding domain-containing protein n=1 Tax=Streptomyces sp. NPDC057757 TaxID=3346241 RepID=UPI0036BD7E52
MSEPNGHVCPECAAPRAPDGSPSCVCTQRASDALRDARTAEAAAAEDFDPLRIRPYVELHPGGADPHPRASSDTDTDPADTAALPAVVVPEFSGVAAAEATMRLGVVPGGAPGLPGPPGGVGAPADEPAVRRRRRVVIPGVLGAGVIVLAGAGFASGLFSYETPSRGAAAPDAVRASVPEVSASSASASPSASVSSTAPVAAVPTPSRSTSASPSASPSPSASASRSASATPTQSATTDRATGPAEATGDDPDDELETSPTLRRGDRGAEVTELQLRLRQLALYIGDIDGDYDRGVEDAVSRYQWARGITTDGMGIYGEATRTSLEKETTEP